MPKGTKIAVVQMNSSAEPPASLELAADLIRESRRRGAELAVLPENFSVMPAAEVDRLAFAEPDSDGPVQSFLSEQARRHGIWIIGGTAPLVGESGGRIKPTCLVFDASGERVAHYQKIHLFDVQVNDAESYRESDAFEPGGTGEDNLVCVDTPAGRVGLSVCYDLRFPALYSRLASRGAQILSVPAAFTAVTGEAHWEPLLRARAIENQAYVVAPAQWGHHASGRRTHGHSMIIDPWGRILTTLESGNGVITADIELEQLADLRKRFPTLDHRRFQ